MSTATSTINIVAKSQLAKLLATENLTVEHRRGVYTATFDTEKRVLTLPIWSSASNDLYDMLVAHEVAHALHTPRMEIAEPMLRAVDPNNPGRFKSYVNITEDIRIDRKIRESFPGLRRSYFNAYRELVDRDFFDLKNTNVADLCFGDRLNIFAKGGQYGFVDVPFTDKEMVIVHAAMAAETFEDAVNVAAMIYQADTSEEDGSSPVNTVIDPNSAHSGCNGGTGNGEGNAETDPNAENSSDNSQGNTAPGGAASRGMMPSSNTMSAPPLRTVDAETRNAQNLVADRTDNYSYVNTPHLDLDKIVFPISTVISDLNGLRSNDQWNGDRIFKIIEDTNKGVVMNLVKQFEQKMAADTLRRTSYAKTGELNMRKISNYKFADDIFLRNKVVQNGKSHGMVFIMDWSGSMSGTLMETVEQLLVLCMFCRRMNIPFDVYAFTNASPMMREDYLKNSDEYTPVDLSKISRDYTSTTHTSAYGHTHCAINYNNFLQISNIGLIHFLSSKSNNTEFRTCAENLCQLARNCAYGVAGKGKFADTHSTYMAYNTPTGRLQGMYGLSGTPLNEAIYSSIFVVNQFKAKHGVDIVNTVFLTDGEAGSIVVGYENRRNNCILNLPNRTQIPLLTRAETEKYWNAGLSDTWVETKNLVTLFRQMTGSNAIGIRIENSRNGSLLMSKFLFNNTERIAKAATSWKEDNYFSCGSDHGFDEMFVIASNAETISNEDIFANIPQNATTARIANAFIRGNGKKMISRTLLNRFTDIISKKVLA